MIFWLLLVVFAIIILVMLWWFMDNPNSIESEQTPTIHAICKSNSACGGDSSDLTCDSHCHRCLKKLNGDCSADIDCEFGLKCHNWKCSFVNGDSSSEDEPPIKPPHRKNIKTVRWDENKNETRFI